MPKHKKTLEQKKKSDARKSSSFAGNHGEHIISSPTYAFSAKHQAHAATSTPAEHVNTISIVRSDVRKTAFISISILAIQVLFFLLLKNHLLAINFVRY